MGGGILGLTLAYRLSARGHAIELFEASPSLGGLAAAQDYGPFVWDRFYHCILPTDTHLIELLGDLGLGAELRWAQTGTGYYSAGRLHPMNTVVDYLRFPRLSWVDKARLGAAVMYATRVADPWALYQVSAEAWLSRVCGRRAYRAFWQPLLRAKFGTFHDQVAAVTIWATLKRLTGARSAVGTKEQLGYARGGYERILGRMAERLESAGATLHRSAPVSAVEPEAAPGDPRGGCRLSYRSAQGEERQARFDQVFFTGPTPAARRAATGGFASTVERVAREHPTSAAHLGVACMVLALRRPLTPFYVLNIGEQEVELTGVVEMTNLIDRQAETAGLSLIYLPQYMGSDDPRLDAPDEVLAERMMGRGLERLFPALAPADVVYRGIHRARFVQPLPLVRSGGARPLDLPTLDRPFQVLNTSMLTCATLNNNEVVGLVDRFIDAHGGALNAQR